MKRSIFQFRNTQIDYFKKPTETVQSETPDRLCQLTPETYPPNRCADHCSEQRSPTPTRVHFGDVSVILENDTSPKRHLRVGTVEQFPCKERVNRYKNPRCMPDTLVGLSLMAQNQPIRQIYRDEFARIKDNINIELRRVKEQLFRSFHSQFKMGTDDVYRYAAFLAQDFVNEMNNFVESFWTPQANALLDLPYEECQKQLAEALECHIKDASRSYDVDRSPNQCLSNAEKMIDLFSIYFLNNLHRMAPDLASRITDFVMAVQPGRAERVVRALSAIFG